MIKNEEKKKLMAFTANQPLVWWDVSIFFIFFAILTLFIGITFKNSQ